MRRIGSGLLLAAIAVGGCRGRGLIQPVRDPRFVENPAVVTLVAWGSPIEGGGGTGFLVAPDRLVTCRHVLAGRESVVFRLADGRQAPIRGVLAEAQEHDLLLLAVDPVDAIAPLTLSDAVPKDGEVLTAVGSPNLRAQTVTRVVVEGGESTSGTRGSLFRVRGALAPGSSGCPVIDARGRVAGVLAEGGLSGDLFGAVPARFVRALSAGPLEPMASWGARTAADPESRAEREYGAAAHAFWEKDYKGALSTCEKLLPRVLALPEYAEAVVDLLGRSLIALGRADEALERIRSIAAAHANEAWAHRALATHLGRMGRNAEALPELAEASRLDPGRSKTHADAAYALMSLGKFVEGEGEARAALALSPSWPWAHFFVGTALLGQKKFADAVPFLDTAHRGLPKEEEVSTNLGWALARAGRVSEGIALLEEAVRIAPRDAIAREDLARARLLAGDREGAARENEMLRRFDPPAAGRVDAALAEGDPARPR